MTWLDDIPRVRLFGIMDVGETFMKTIRKALEEVNSKIKVRAAMPGHKGRLVLSSHNDVTELPGVDNLHHPTGVIEAAEKRAAEIYGVRSARYLVNGSSSGNLTMIFSFFKEGDEILVERTCHKSVYNALVLRKLRPVYLWPKLDAYGSTLPVTAEAVLAALDSHPGIQGVFLTQPSYKGLVSDLEAIHAACREKGAPLLIDAAHGAGLAGMADFKEFYASCDAMVVSAHKSLACLNQGAVLLNNRPELSARLMKYSNMFQTTSPSYLIMSSIEESLEELAEGRYLKGPDIRLDAFDNLILDPVGSIYRKDPWKLLAVCRGQGAFMDSFLEDRGIYAEFHDEHSVLFMLSPGNRPEELRLIEEVLAELDQAVAGRAPEGGAASGLAMPPAPEAVLQPNEVGEDYEEVALEASAGRIAWEQVTPYPPGVPLLLPGEKIDQAMVEHLAGLERMDIEIIGIHEGSLRCLKGGDGPWGY